MLSFRLPEGSGGIWERLHHNWSDPNHVILTTTDSNVWGGASGHTYTFTRQPNGTTEINVVVVNRIQISRTKSGFAACCAEGLCPSERHGLH
ncbi:MAG TPA: hypothetical protein VMI06_17965 [Terriglobia bacterium]|nr:hypothetical protein [Terriglobia bacterium]